MTRFKLQVPREVLGTLSFFVAKEFGASEEQTTAMLHCIHIEAGSKSTRLIASNGEATLIYSIPEGVANTTETIKANIRVWDGFKPDANGNVLITEAMFECSSVYPDYRREIPLTISGEAAHLDPRYVGKVALVAEWLMHRYDAYKFVTFGQNGTGNTIFKIGGIDNLIGILKPMPALTKAIESVPAWVSEPLEVAEDFSDLL